MIRAIGCSLACALLSNSVFAGTLLLSLEGDSVVVTNEKYRVLINEEEVGMMRGQDLFRLPIQTQDEIFVRVFDMDKLSGGYSPVVVPDQGNMPLTIVVKSTGVNKPVVYQFNAIINENLDSDFNEFTIRFFDRFHPNRLVKVGEIWDIHIENSAYPNGLVRLNDLFHISDVGFLEVKDINQLKTIMAKIRGKAFMVITALSTERDKLGAEAVFTIAESN